MRSKLLFGILLALIGVWASGCMLYRAPVVPPFARVFNNTSAPMNLQFRSTQLGAKRGEATSSSILGLVSWGDSSAAAAAQSAGIKTIRHVDSRALSVVLVYQAHTTIVYGD